MGDQRSLFHLFQTPEKDRPHDWEITALDLLPRAHLKLISPQAQQGPDGWPYLMVECVADGTGEPAIQVLTWLKDRGIGLAINPSQTPPDLVLPYGAIWYFGLAGKFLRLDAPAREGALELEAGQKILAGPPAKEYLPDGPRKVIKQFLFDQGVLRPKVLVVTKDQVHFDLAFSLESLGLPPDSELDGILEALSWFLPGHYSLVLLSESDLGGFVDL